MRLSMHVFWGWEERVAVLSSCGRGGDFLRGIIYNWKQMGYMIMGTCKRC